MKNARTPHDDMRLPWSARMLDERGAGAPHARTRARGRRGCAAACGGRSSVRAVADIGLSCSEAVPSATVISRCRRDCGFCV